MHEWRADRFIGPMQEPKPLPANFPWLRVVNTGTSPAPEGAMRVGPNTDAVVWKICDTNQTVEL